MSTLPDKLPIRPFTQPVRGEVMPPGSKSLTNRALLLAALCPQPVTLTGALSSEDSGIMVDALRVLGLAVETDENGATLRISGQNKLFNAPRSQLFTGLAGTAARFLTALCAAAPRGIHHIGGTARMRERPMQGLIEALRTLGARIDCTGAEGHLPLEIHACGLRGGPVTMDARDSSQFLSALLMAAPLARTPVEVTLQSGVRMPFVQMTARLMTHFGQPPVQQLAADRFRVAAPVPYGLPEGTYAIEPDASAASYLLALPLVTGGRLTLPGLRDHRASLQGDIRVAEVMQAAGVVVSSTRQGLSAERQAGRPRQGVKQDFSEYSDTFLTLAAIAPLLEGPTRISGIAHTRKQETDRLAGAARELTKLGQHVVETADAIEIHPRPLPEAAEIETYGDHRFAMSFALLGCHDRHGDGRPWLTIKDPAVCAKTFPAFFDLLARLHAGSH